MSGKEKKKEKETVTKQSLLAAKEVAGLLKTFSDGDDIEEHLRRLDDVADLMMIDDIVKYQAMLLSMEESIRGEFNAWLKTENLRDEVRGDPGALKKRLLDKFRVRKSILERVAFVTQPRRSGKRIVTDVLERQHVYNDLIDELTRNKERLLVEATMQLLSQEDRTDYCNLRPEEKKREMNDLLEFIRRKEEEKQREETQLKTSSRRDNDDDVKTSSRAGSDDDVKRVAEEAKLKTIVAREGAKSKKTSSRVDDDDETEEEERERLFQEGRCFVCKKIGHVAAMCPLVRVKKKPTAGLDDQVRSGHQEKEKFVAGATRSSSH